MARKKRKKKCRSERPPKEKVVVGVLSPDQLKQAEALGGEGFADALPKLEQLGYIRRTPDGGIKLLASSDDLISPELLARALSGDDNEPKD